MAWYHKLLDLVLVLKQDAGAGHSTVRDKSDTCIKKAVYYCITECGEVC